MKYLFTLITLAILITSCDEYNWETADNGFLSYSYMEEFVKQKLKSPGTATFPGTYERFNHIAKTGAKEYVIKSWVDSQNSFGGTVRTNFVGEIVQLGPDQFGLVSLDFY